MSPDGAAPSAAQPLGRSQARFEPTSPGRLSLTGVEQTLAEYVHTGKRRPMASDAAPEGPMTARFLARPIHHVGFNVPDLRAAIDSWVSVYGAGPFYVNEHVGYDECNSSGTPAVWDHSAGFGQWGAVPVELQQTHDLRPAELVRPFTADGRSAVNHVGVTAKDPAAESARLESLGFELCMHARLGDVEFFWHDTTKAFGYCIEVITAGPGIDAFFATVAGGARHWDGRDAIRNL